MGRKWSAKHRDSCTDTFCCILNMNLESDPFTINYRIVWFEELQRSHHIECESGGMKNLKNLT